MNIINLLMGALLISCAAQSMQPAQAVGENPSIKIIENKLPLKIEVMDEESGNYVVLNDERLQKFFSENNTISLRFSNNDFYLCFTLNDKNQFLTYSNAQKIPPKQYRLKGLHDLEKEAGISFNKMHNSLFTDGIKDEEIDSVALKHSFAAESFEKLGFAPFLRKITGAIARSSKKAGVLNKAISLHMCYYISIVSMQEAQNYRLSKVKISQFGQYLSLALGYFFNLGGLKTDDLYKEVENMKSTLVLSEDDKLLFTKLEKFNKKYDTQAMGKIKPAMLLHLDFSEDIQNRLKNEYKELKTWIESCLSNIDFLSLKNLRKLQDFFKDKGELDIEQAINFNTEVILSHSDGFLSPLLQDYKKDSSLKNAGIYKDKIEILEEMLNMERSLFEDPQLLWKYMIHSELPRLLSKLFSKCLMTDNETLQRVDTLISWGDFRGVTSLISPLILLAKKDGDIGNRAEILLYKASQGFLDLVEGVIFTDCDLSYLCIDLLIQLQIQKGEIGERAARLLVALLDSVERKISLKQNIDVKSFAALRLLEIRSDNIGTRVGKILATLPDGIKPICFLSEKHFLDYLKEVMKLKYQLNMNVCLKSLIPIEENGGVETQDIVKIISNDFIIKTTEIINSDNALNFDVKLTVDLLELLEKRDDNIATEARALLLAIRAITN